MRARILIDNITKDELQPEWGLAVWIDYNGQQFLLDTGASGKFAENASSLGIDLKQVEYGILSHAHFDHADGMAEFFARNDKAKFYLRQGAAENCYGKKWIFSKYIGIHKGYLKTYADRICYVEGDYEIVPGVTLIPHKVSGLGELGKAAGMYVKNNRRMCPDCFAHEQSLVFDTESGLVIFNSCSHGGADNIIREVAETYPGKKIYALIGGLHLFDVAEDAVRALTTRIRETGIEKIYTGHCTGKRAFSILREELGEAVEQIYTGMEIVIAEENK